MFPLLTAILVASLLGSTHCAGMCGAFVAFAVGMPGSTERKPGRWALNAAYNLGRLVTYVVLGAAAGGVGAALDLGGALVGVQRVAACLAGAIMVGFGLVALLRLASVRIPRMPTPPLLVRLSKAAHNRAFDLPPLPRAAAVGLLTTLLPCGWLYAFVAVSAGTASPIRGASAMAAFWLGTLPIMAAIGVGVQAMAGRLRRHLPVLTSLVLVFAGLWTILGRMVMPAIAIQPPVASRSVEQTIETARESAATCPLCGGGGK